MSRREIIEKHIREVTKNNPDLFTEELIQQAIKSFSQREENIAVVIAEINTTVQKMTGQPVTHNEYLNSLETFFNGTNYTNVNIENVDISTFTNEELDKMFFHYSWKKYLESYDTNGMKPTIGENSKNLDHKPSIFFSEGIIGALELWDVWLKWRLNRQNNPQFRGQTDEEIEATNERYQAGNITETERKEWEYWILNFRTGQYLHNEQMLTTLFDYQYTELVNSDYFSMDLKRNVDFVYDQIDIKKQKALEISQGGTIDPITATQYGNYSNLASPFVDQWNMQTIPGKDMTIEPSRLKRLTIGGKDDAYSIMKHLYDRYKQMVPVNKQVKFDLLDNFVSYVSKKKLATTKEESPTIHRLESEPELETPTIQHSNTQAKLESPTIQQPDSQIELGTPTTQQPKPESEPEFTTFKKKKEARQAHQANINQMSEAHQEIYQQQTQITEQHNQLRQMANQKGKKLTKQLDGNENSSGGFVNTLIIPLIAVGVAVIIFLIAYFLCQ